MESPAASSPPAGVNVLPARERPLGRSARFTLALSAFLAIGGFYAFSLLSILVLSLVLMAESLVLAVLIRFGFAGVMVPVLRRHGDLLTIFVRSFWIRSAAVSQLPIHEADAPRLFAALRRISTHFGVPAPREVLLEMSAGAWVRLKGFRRRSATVLGLGFDLVVGLSEVEVEAVLAHEMAHAQRVHRGMNFWLTGGINRAAAVCSALSDRVATHRHKGGTFELGETFLRGADACTRLVVRMYAAYSRQDEFDADAGAAALCGSTPLRTSLLKIEAIAAKAGRIGWNERVAQLQNGRFGAWLRAELNVESAATAAAPSVHDRYATHPSTADRIAAMPPGSDAAPSPPAIELFAHPDDLARRMVAEIQRFQAVAERKDDVEVRRWLRAVARGRGISFPLLQWLAILLAVVGLIVAGFAWADSFTAIPLVVGGVMFAAGVWSFRRLNRRRHFVLAVPSYESLVAEAQPSPPGREKELEAELERAVQGLSRRKKVAYLSKEALAALGNPDYLRAHCASRLAVQLKTKVTAPHLALGIASAAFGQGAQATGHLRLVIQRIGVKVPEVEWGGAWLLWLLGDCLGAEAMLAAALKREPENSTLHALTSICQGRRNKFQSAIAHARRALAANPTSPVRRELLAAWLVETGQIQEAEQILTQDPNQLRQIPALTVLMIRAQLLRGDFAEADRWIDVLRNHGILGQKNVEIARACEQARRDELAMSFYTAAASEGHCPEARLGLARIHERRGERTTAREQVLASLNTSVPVLATAANAFQLFPQAMAHLRSLNDPAECTAWQAVFRRRESLGPLSGQTFLIFASDRPEAERHLAEVLAALNPTTPPVLAHEVVWKKAPADLQPARPVPPGVLGV